MLVSLNRRLICVGTRLFYRDKRTMFAQNIPVLLYTLQEAFRKMMIYELKRIILVAYLAEITFLRHIECKLNSKLRY